MAWAPSTDLEPFGLSRQEGTEQGTISFLGVGGGGRGIPTPLHPKEDGIPKLMGACMLSAGSSLLKDSFFALIHRQR